MFLFILVGGNIIFSHVKVLMSTVVHPGLVSRKLDIGPPVMSNCVHLRQSNIEQTLFRIHVEKRKISSFMRMKTKTATC